MKTEKGENEEKNGRGTLNRQAAVTIETGKLYPNCQNLISSASFCIRDGSSSRLKRKQTIKIHHKWNQKSLRDIWYCHALMAALLLAKKRMHWRDLSYFILDFKANVNMIEVQRHNITLTQTYYTPREVFWCTARQGQSHSGGNV